MSDNTEKTTVVIQLFENLFEANLCKNKLADHGIDSFILDENVVGLNPMGTVELKIFVEDLEKAKEILNNQ